MKRRSVPKRLPINSAAALHAICSTGKGRCWHCDAKLPPETEAIASGWDVQRFDDHPVASIILVCPACLREPATPRDEAGALQSVSLHAIPPPRRSRLRRPVPQS
ncbi:MAG: hypothetical protein ACRD3D_00565 [Terriglobia bacterium]